MKVNLNIIISGLAIATTVLLSVLLMNTPVAANEIQQVVNGGIYPREPNFFSRGREQFDREIQLLLDRNDAAADTLLKVSPEVQRLQERLAPREKPANSQELLKPSQHSEPHR
ncbi:hypothetical protein Cylst_0406 [Cylindrospermum stagnale PCC 7417]|uniref:Uncharacterized protein n=1 Tax=Cylindrospermum stagnale PCC 7417 TaxID=56107 RepID=K9WSK2_9NOST|nr:hypothetical protein [Cylindrospermum stagnale]AFZ22756.1 hypothetical protein Cylst_0406 [Cylindrospermum stagnale PCC 7417]